MATYLKIIKKSPSSWWFEIDGFASSLRTSSYYECNIGDTFNLVELDGSKIFVKDIENITLIDEYTGFTYTNTNNPILFEDRLKALNFPPYLRQSQFLPINAFCRDINIVSLTPTYTLNIGEKVSMVFIDQAPQYKAQWSQSGTTLTLTTTPETGSVMTISGIIN